MTLTPAQLGLIRGLGVAIIMALLTYFGDATHLNGIVGPSIGAVISMMALSLEHYLASGTGTALFGAVNTQ